LRTDKAYLDSDFDSDAAGAGEEDSDFLLSEPDSDLDSDFDSLEPSLLAGLLFPFVLA